MITPEEWPTVLTIAERNALLAALDTVVKQRGLSAAEGALRLAEKLKQPPSTSRSEPVTNDAASASG